MPVVDARTPWPGRNEQREKKSVAARSRTPVDADSLLNELRSETVRLVAGVVAEGGAVLFGSVRNRSALLIRAWIAGDTYEDYASSVAELSGVLEGLEDVLSGAASRSLSPLRNRP